MAGFAVVSVDGHFSPIPLCAGCRNSALQTELWLLWFGIGGLAGSVEREELTRSCLLTRLKRRFRLCIRN